MNHYELTFVINSKYHKDRVTQAAEAYKSYLPTQGCKVVHFNRIGLKKLAYPINNQNFGYYFCIEFIGPGEIVKKLNLKLKRDERMLRYLTIKLDHHGVKYNEEKRYGYVGENRQKRNRFVIFCNARSGSYLLIDFLNQFPKINCHGELFKEDRIELKNWWKRLQFNSRTRDLTPYKFLDKVFSLSPNDCTGFKIFPEHNEKIRNYLLHDKFMKKVLLKRNLLEQFISLKYAYACGVWINKNDEIDDLVDSNIKVHFDLDEFSEFYDMMTEFYESIEKVCKNNNHYLFEIDYTQVVDQSEIHNLAEFLGVSKTTAEGIKLKVNLKKQIQKEYSLIIENFNEMINSLERMHGDVLKSSIIYKQLQNN